MGKDDSGKQTWHRIKERFSRAVDYLSINAFVLVVYSGCLITDYLLFKLVTWLLREDIERYPLVSTACNYLTIGLALLTLFGAAVHGALSTARQIELDFKLSREGENRE